MARDVFPDGRVTGWRSFLLSRTDRIECVCRHPRPGDRHLGIEGMKELYHEMWESGEIEAECCITHTKECGSRVPNGRRAEVPCLSGGLVACGVHAYAEWEGLQSNDRYATRPGRSYTTEVELGGDRLVSQIYGTGGGHEVLRATRAKVLRVVCFEEDVRWVEPIAARWGVPLELCGFPDDGPTGQDRRRPRAVLLNVA